MLAHIKTKYPQLSLESQAKQKQFIRNIVNRKLKIQRFTFWVRLLRAERSFCQRSFVEPSFDQIRLFELMRQSISNGSHSFCVSPLVHLLLRETDRLTVESHPPKFQLLLFWELSLSNCKRMVGSASKEQAYDLVQSAERSILGRQNPRGLIVR